MASSEELAIEGYGKEALCPGDNLEIEQTDGLSLFGNQD